MLSISTIGAGFVGNAVARGFNVFAEVKVYDINPLLATHTFEEAVNCDFVFLALPTPMTKVEGGECNLSIIEGFFEKVASIATVNQSIYVIKSTVPVGTTRAMSEKYNIRRLVHNPEFLTAKNAVFDFAFPSRNIVGGQDIVSVNKVADLLRSRFPNTLCYTMSSEESEMIKYVSNCFLMTKIVFFNEVYLLAQKMGLNWDMIVKGVTADSRIGTSHCKVPGDDGSMGGGGFCFPKDINAFITTCCEHGVDPIVLKAVWEQNKKVRKVWDWAESKSSVLEKK